MRKVDSSHSINVDDHHFELVANADNRLNVRDTVLSKLTDVNHSVLARKDVYESTERHDSDNPTSVLVANLNVFGKSGDSGFGLIGVFTIR